MYAAEKEFRRWHHMHVPARVWESYLLIWTILVVGFLIAQAIPKYNYAVPVEVTIAYLSVIVIFAVAQGSKSRYAKKTKTAFTLIELLVVMAIISLLSSVVLLTVNEVRSKGRDTRRISDVHQIRNAFYIYKSSVGSDPDPNALGCNNPLNLYCLGVPDGMLCNAPKPATGCTALNEALEPYIEEIPTDPRSAGTNYSNAYVYDVFYLYNSVPPGSGIIRWGMEKTIINQNDCLGGTPSGTGSTRHCFLQLN
jgi:prepilin-type N-terminal cleavage/methylation domain-containing protein